MIKWRQIMTKLRNIKATREHVLHARLSPTCKPVSQSTSRSRESAERWHPSIHIYLSINWCHHSSYYIGTIATYLYSIFTQPLNKVVFALPYIHQYIMIPFTRCKLFPVIALIKVCLLEIEVDLYLHFILKRHFWLHTNCFLLLH